MRSLREPRVDVPLHAPAAACLWMNRRHRDVVAHRLGHSSGLLLRLGCRRWVWVVGGRRSSCVGGLGDLVGERRDRSRSPPRRPRSRARPGTRAPSPAQDQSVPPPAHPSVRDRAAPFRASARRARPAARSRRRPPRRSPRWPPARRPPASARSASTAAVGALAHSRRRTPAAPDRSPARYCSSVAPWCDSRCARSSTRRRSLVVDERLGRLDRHEIGDRFEHLVAHRHLRLQLLHQSRAACGCRRAARRRCRTRSPRRPTRR